MSFSNKSDKLNEIRKKYKLSSSDTGSAIVQIALLTFRIDQLSEHFKVHKKDNHSKVGFLKLISQRKKFLKYLSKKNPEIRSSFAQDLGLRK